MTTGIGSLPHINTDSAVAYSFRHDIPFLPQLPIYNKNEYMLYQSLSRLPGITKPVDGMCFVDLKEWAKTRKYFLKEVKKAKATGDYSNFLPSMDTWSAINPFLFEVDRKRPPLIKLQLAGPFTCVSSLKLTDHSPVKDFPDLVKDILLQVEMSLKALILKFSQTNSKILFFWDEPGLIVYSSYQSLQYRLFETILNASRWLKENNVAVGIHCCADILWEQVLPYPHLFDYLSFDLEASGHSLFELKEELQFFCKHSSLAIGIVPSTHSSEENYESKLPKLKILKKLKLNNLLLSPACGLAHQSLANTEEVLRALNQEKATSHS